MNGTGNTARGLTVAIVLFLLWAALTGIVRGWVKLKKRDSWGFDDTSIYISLLVNLVRIVIVTGAIHHGFGNLWSTLAEDDRQTVDKLLYASQILYVVSIGLVKVSTTLFTARFLTRGQTHIRLAHLATAACGVWTVASLLIIAIRTPLSSPWTTRAGSQSLLVRWVAIEASGLIVELCAVGMSVHFVWGLQMPIKKRLSVSALFAFRLVVAPVIALRLWQLAPSAVKNPDEPRLNAYILTEGALELAFILASITCLKPVMKPFHSGYTVSNAPASNYITTVKKSNRDAYLELSAARSAADNKDGTIIVTRRDRGSHGIDHGYTKSAHIPRPDQVDHEATVSFANEGQPHPDSHDMSISRTQAWTISYDDDEGHGGARQ
ncbi:hypothetical protein B0A55_06608 [Friedmanniomyces simplex]|uniref:Rhodopsin domain-containing protein n=1 Tax=Friedmanniomyces simplex TaxID=329884 RepID=A0A4U0X073_9PEZI|nr:hypothetical protein B0A55_06608 [Friedmanniomyces simplex]